MTNKKFHEDHLIHELKHFLPSQQALKDFIHHNTLHAFQHMKFYDAIFKASKIFGYQVSLELHDYRSLYQTKRIREDILIKCIEKKKGIHAVKDWKEKLLYHQYNSIIEPRIGQLRKYWKLHFEFDLDNHVHPLLFRIICSFLDQGISIQKYPVANKSFIESIRHLENNSFVSFFKTKKIRKLFVSGNYSIESLLNSIVGNEDYFGQYLFDQQFAHHGWSGFVSAIEDNPQTLLDHKKITLKEFIEFELLLELDTLQHCLKNKWQPIGNISPEQPIDLFEDVAKTEFVEVIEIWQDAFESSYYDTVFAGILLAKKEKDLNQIKNFQAIFCIDERECSIRRHVESNDKNSETFGAPGFFGVEFFFQQEGNKFYDKLCPAPVTPKYLIKESNATTKNKSELLYSKHTHSFFGGIVSTLIFGHFALVKKMLLLFLPKMSPAISDAFSHMDNNSILTIENKGTEDVENELQIGYTLNEMVSRAENFLRSIGLIKDFAPLIYFVAHGSSSANNPHHGAHDCGACSGRPGATNARVMSFILNHLAVREKLKEKGIDIPPQTQCIACMHDTAADIFNFYDEHILNNENAAKHQQHIKTFEQALNLNAKERSRRFASINTKNKIDKVRKAILDRSVSLFEPRPELGHGTNAVAIIGNRNISKGVFLDRRAFLNSYDYKTDPDGKILEAVMRPIGVVCGGINLEYYFSRVDNIKLGAGTKLPHNVIGLFGVANSSDGDLRPGLPWQMIEVHDPVRLLVIVEHLPEIVLKAIQASPEVYEWYKNEWVHIAAYHPTENCFYYFKDEVFEKYIPLTKELQTINNFNVFLEEAKEMETNHIVDATQENLSVHLINYN